MGNRVTDRSIQYNAQLFVGTQHTTVPAPLSSWVFLARFGAPHLALYVPVKQTRVFPGQKDYSLELRTSPNWWMGLERRQLWRRGWIPLWWAMTAPLPNKEALGQAPSSYCHKGPQQRGQSVPDTGRYLHCHLELPSKEDLLLQGGDRLFNSRQKREGTPSHHSQPTERKLMPAKGK